MENIELYAKIQIVKEFLGLIVPLLVVVGLMIFQFIMYRRHKKSKSKPKIHISKKDLQNDKI